MRGKGSPARAPRRRMPSSRYPPRALGSNGEAQPRLILEIKREWENRLGGRDDPWAELHARQAADLGEGFRGRPCFAVASIGEHGVECVGDVDDARAKWDLLAVQAVGIARPVP